MPIESRIVAPGPNDHSVRTAGGDLLSPPDDWTLLPPGDAALTRRVKAAGPTWTVQQKRGRKLFSLGVWAPKDRIETIREELSVERAKPQYAKRRKADAKRRECKQEAYVGSFRQAVFDFLAFAPCYRELAERLADAVAQHATPVGSGTVARTQRIPIHERAEAAVIAWLRHQTTAYDRMAIPRIKGKRREVRRMLAEESRRLLEAYRKGRPTSAADCPLQRALPVHAASPLRRPAE
jgi:hypothetical protein